MPKTKSKKKPSIKVSGTSLEDFTGDLLEFVSGGGPATGLWRQFQDWLLELGYTEEQIHEHCKEIMIAAGKEWDG
jgi:hypothetical protein